MLDQQEIPFFYSRTLSLTVPVQLYFEVTTETSSTEYSSIRVSWSLFELTKSIMISFYFTSSWTSQYSKNPTCAGERR